MSVPTTTSVVNRSATFNSPAAPPNIILSQSLPHQTRSKRTRKSKQNKSYQHQSPQNHRQSSVTTKLRRQSTHRNSKSARNPPPRWRPFVQPVPSLFSTPTVLTRPSTRRRNLGNPQNYTPRTLAVSGTLVNTLPSYNTQITSAHDDKDLLSLLEQSQSVQSLCSLHTQSSNQSLKVELDYTSGYNSGSDIVTVPAKLLRRYQERALSPSDNITIQTEPSSTMRSNEGKDELPMPPSIVDIETGSIRGGRLRSTSKVSLPARSDEQTAQQRISSASDVEWGPTHPCYPHLNPHVPLDSPLYPTTRIIRIPRDWMVAGDLAPTFANVYPEVLEGLLSEEQFRQLLRRINDEVVDIFNPFSLRNWADSFVGLITLWIWDDLGMTGVKRRLNALEYWIEQWNKDVGAQDGVQIVPLRRTAYMSLDIQIPDPEISPDPHSTARQDEAALLPDASYGVENMPVPPRIAISS